MDMELEVAARNNMTIRQKERTSSESSSVRSASGHFEGKIFLLFLSKFLVTFLNWITFFLGRPFFLIAWLSVCFKSSRIPGCFIFLNIRFYGFMRNTRSSNKKITVGNPRNFKNILKL